MYMFKNIGQWTQRELKLYSLFLNFLYFTFTFIAPFITALILCNGVDIEQQVKAPITVIIVGCTSILGIAAFAGKKVNGINVLNLDGSYNRKAQVTKHVLQFLCSSIVLIVLLIASVVFRTALHNAIDFYVTLICWILGFVLLGKFVDKIFLSEIEEERDIRKKVAEANAVNARLNLK